MMPKYMTRILKEWNEHKAWVVVAVILIMTLIYYAKWKADKPPQYIKVPEIREVIRYKIKRVEVPIETGNVVVLDKAEVGKRIKGLPENFMKDPAKQITSTADIPAKDKGTDVLNIIDTKTGVSEMFSKDQKPPFFVLENKNEAGIRAGLTDRGQELNVYYQKDIARVGTLHAGAYVEGSYRNDTEDQAGWKVMGVISKKW